MKRDNDNNVRVEFKAKNRRSILRDMNRHEKIEKEIMNLETKILKLAKEKSIIENKYSESFN